MATQGNSLAERIARMELLEKALAPLIEEKPHLAASHAELRQLIEEAKDLELRFQQMRAGGREASRLRRELVQQGDVLRQRLAAALRFEHGFQSERLLEFGLQPRHARAKAQQVEVKPPPQPAPEPTPSPPAVAASGDGKPKE